MKRKPSKAKKPESKVPKLQMEEEREESPFELLLRNPGYNFIVNQICENLTLNDLAKCHRVSKRFREILYHNKPWWIEQLRFIKSTPKSFGEERGFIEETFPQFHKVFNYFENTKDIYKLQEFVFFMKGFFKDKNVKESPIFYAVRKGQTRIFELLMESPLDIKEERDNSNATLLHVACDVESLGIVKLLMKTEIDCNAVDEKGRTPLHNACSQDNLNIVKLLLDNPKIDYTLVDAHGRNAFHQCVISHKHMRRVPTINEMMNNGSEIIDRGGIILKHLVETCKDLDINAKDNQGYSIAHLVADVERFYGHPSLNYLMNLGTVDFQATTNTGSTPLHLACKNNAFETVSKLLKHIQAEAVNARDGNGWTPLHEACNKKHKVLDLVELLLKNNANPTQPTVRGQTPLHVACRNLHGFEIVLRLLKYLQPEDIDALDNASWTPFHLACRYGSMRTVDLLLKNNANVGLTTNEWSTPLHLAVSNDNQEILKSLITKYPELINLKDTYGWTILHFICKYNKVNTLQFVMKLKNTNMDFNAVNNAGHTPLHYAADRGHEKVVKLLLKNSEKLNIDINKKSSDGKTAKDIAMLKGKQTIVDLIQTFQS